MYTAKDIMTKSVICAWPQMPIYEAIRLLITRRVGAMPVVDENLNLLGCLYEKNILEIVYSCQEDQHKTVADFMEEMTKGISENDKLINMCEYLIHKGCRGVPVTADGKLIGIINRSDLVRALLKLKRQERSI